MEIFPWIIRVLLDWIAGLLNPDCNPFWWIWIGLTIQKNRIEQHQPHIAYQIFPFPLYLDVVQKLTVLS